MRYLAAIAITSMLVFTPFSATAEQPNLSWPTFAELNHSYAAKASRAENGFQVEYRVGGRSFTKQVSVPAELWSKMKSDFNPREADVVVTASGELSSVGVREKGRELWITFDRSRGRANAWRCSIRPVAASMTLRIRRPTAAALISLLPACPIRNIPAIYDQWVGVSSRRVRLSARLRFFGAR